MNGCNIQHNGSGKTLTPIFLFYNVTVLLFSSDLQLGIRHPRTIIIVIHGHYTTSYKHLFKFFPRISVITSIAIK